MIPTSHVCIVTPWCTMTLGFVINNARRQWSDSNYIELSDKKYENNHETNALAGATISMPWH